MKLYLAALPAVFLATTMTVLAQTQTPLRVGVVGLTHDHVHAVLRQHADKKLTIVGIAEPNRQLAQRLGQQYGYDMKIVFDDLDEMLEAAKPVVVSDYRTIYGHKQTVESAAPRGIHVMVEKPLAVSLNHARQMERLARQHSIHLLTNYETTWYASHHAAKELLAEESFGSIRKIVVHDGHQGPAEIGCSDEFLEWLVDPKLSGGGALTDFGCYGANLVTWLMDGAKPMTVTAVTQQIKPDKYPNVDDEATIILTYPSAQAIIQASWNWNYNRKDIEIYSKNGFVHCHSSTDIEIMRPNADQAVRQSAAELQPTLADPYIYLAAVSRGQHSEQPSDLSALENNMTVIEILEAAKISARRSERSSCVSSNRNSSRSRPHIAAAASQHTATDASSHLVSDANISFLPLSAIRRLTGLIAAVSEPELLRTWWP